MSLPVWEEWIEILRAASSAWIWRMSLPVWEEWIEILPVWGDGIEIGSLPVWEEWIEIGRGKTNQ